MIRDPLFHLIHFSSLRATVKAGGVSCAVSPLPYTLSSSASNRAHNKQLTSGGSVSTGRCPN